MQYAKIVVSHSSSRIIKCETFLSKEIPERVTKKKNKISVDMSNKTSGEIFFF